MGERGKDMGDMRHIRAKVSQLTDTEPQLMWASRKRLSNQCGTAYRRAVWPTDRKLGLTGVKFNGRLRLTRTNFTRRFGLTRTYFTEDSF